MMKEFVVLNSNWLTCRMSNFYKGSIFNKFKEAIFLIFQFSNNCLGHQNLLKLSLRIRLYFLDHPNVY